MSLNSFISGITSEIPGNIEVTMMIASTKFLPRNSSRARV